MLERTCKSVEAELQRIFLPEDTSQEDFLRMIESLNQDESVHGILIQKPLASHIDASAVMLAVHPKKDLDGFHPLNAGRMLLGEMSHRPCTPQAAIKNPRK